jgi:hypothetical protein
MADFDIFLPIYASKYARNARAMVCQMQLNDLLTIEHPKVNLVSFTEPAHEMTDDVLVLLAMRQADPEFAERRETDGIPGSAFQRRMNGDLLDG